MTRPASPPRIATPLLLTLACALGPFGCGESLPSAGAMHPVKGKVVFSPLTALTGLKIQFLPKTGSTARIASGDIRADGSFDLTTTAPGDGIAEGEYQVRLDRGGPLPKGKTSPIPQPYFDEDGAFLSATIKADTTELPPFDLKPISAESSKRSGRKDND